MPPNALVPALISSGHSSMHLFCALKQRVWKRHPFGGLMGLATSPCSIILFFAMLTSGSGTGIAERSACVYGCSGFLCRPLLVYNSTSLPRYITPMRFEMCLTTARSWAINRYVRPNSFCRSIRILIICAWMETSKRGYRLVAYNEIRTDSKSPGYADSLPLAA